MLAALARLALPTWARHTAPPTRSGEIRAAQQRIRRRLVHLLAPRAIGAQLGLPGVAAAADQDEAFRHLPVTEYADYQALIERTGAGESGLLFPGRAKALAQTSGTTRDANAGERFIPQSSRLLRHHRRGGAAALARALGATRTKVLAGRLMMVGGSTSLDTRRAVPMGDLSGIAAARLPAWIRHRHEPGPEVSGIPDWQTRLEAITARCARRPISLVAGIPSWMLVVFERIARARGVARLGEAWPQLELLIHGGHGIEPFVEPLRSHLSDDTWMMEVYPASEAFIAIGARPWRLGEGAPPPLELLSDHGAYLEFLPEGAPGEAAVGAERLEAGGIYRLLVTTPGGLVRYQVGDLVRAEGPGLVRVAGRVKARISVFGEHVEGFELARALASASASEEAAVANYHVAPVLPSASEPRGAHEWLIEFSKAPLDLGRFAAAIDRHLRSNVLDYDAHRQGDGQLLPPRVRALPAGSFAAFLATRGKMDAQRKIPQAWPDRSIADQLLSNKDNGA